MQFMSIRELRNQSTAIQRAVQDDEVALTVNGKPFALVIGLEEGDDPAELVRMVAQARAQWAVSRMRRDARRAGLDALTMDEIDEEIRAARAERRR